MAKPGPKTGDEFIKLAEERGAVVTPAGNFVKIKTPKGTMKMAPGHTTLDKFTVGNIRRWFRLLGLMIVLLSCIFPLLNRFIWNPI